MIKSAVQMELFRDLAVAENEATGTASASSCISALAEIAGGKAVAAIVSIFSAIEVAEEEIAAFRRQHPEKDRELWNSFMALKITPPLREKSLRLYRAHCRELLERVVAGQDLRPGTNAEILAVLSNASLVAPLTHQAAVLAFRLADELLGWREGVEYNEPWPGAADELAAVLRHKLTVPDRRLPPPEEWSEPRPLD